MNLQSVALLQAWCLRPQNALSWRITYFFILWRPRNILEHFISLNKQDIYKSNLHNITAIKSKNHQHFPNHFMWKAVGSSEVHCESTISERSPWLLAQIYLDRISDYYFQAHVNIYWVIKCKKRAALFMNFYFFSS